MQLRVARHTDRLETVTRPMRESPPMRHRDRVLGRGTVVALREVHYSSGIGAQEAPTSL